MTYIRRLAYFVYYLRQLDWALLAKFMAYVHAKRGWSNLNQWGKVFRDSMRFNVSILEYYQFRFFEIEDAEKAEWAGTGTMYEFQRRASPPGVRELLNDKRRFYVAYKQFFQHELYTASELAASHELVESLLENNEKLVFKEATGNCGKGVLIRGTSDISAKDLVDYLEQENFDIVETFVQQHDALNSLSPSAVNTVRIFTQIRSNGVYEVIGCRLRISIDSPVDNLAAGNMAASIDIETGKVNGPGVYSDMTREPAKLHPVTGVAIEGFQIPFWNEILDMVEQASLLHPENRSIGWDVVVTGNGPGLIEGNHDWCKLVWQLPVRRGLFDLLDLDL